jgi:nucleotide-binding universal stress UspA family protein
MIKRILLPLDKSEFTEAATNFAIKIADAHNAEITGLVVIDIPGIKSSIGPLPPGVSFYAKELEQSRIEKNFHHVDKVLDTFRNACTKAGVQHRTGMDQGSPSETITAKSLYYDVLVMGMETHYEFDSEDKPGDSFGDILGETITPVYAIPKDYFPPRDPDTRRTVLFPFDGSLPAARAMQRFAQLANPINIEVHLLISHDSKTEAENILGHAEKYLKIHGVNAVEKHYTSENIIRHITKNHMDWPDSIVLGAHSKKGIFDFMSGSLTRFLIQEGKKPLFIGQ